MLAERLDATGTQISGHISEEMTFERKLVTLRSSDALGICWEANAKCVNVLGSLSVSIAFSNSERWNRNKISVSMIDSHDQIISRDLTTVDVNKIQLIPSAMTHNHQHNTLLPNP